MIKQVTTISAIMGLTACGGTTLNEGHFAGIENSSVAAFVSGPNNTTIQTGGAYLIRDDEARTVRVGSEQTISATALPQPDGSMHINVVGLGHDVTLTPDDLTAYDDEYEIELPDGTTVWFWTNSGSWQDVLDGATEYDFVFTYGMSDYSDDQINNRVEGVFGLLTNPSDMPVSGSAEYNGTLTGPIYDMNDSYSVWYLEGDVALYANFQDGTVNGDITDLSVVGELNPWVSLEINEADIESGQFQTDISLDPDHCSNVCNSTLTSELNGAFYGTEAQEAGGNLTMAFEEEVDGEAAGFVFNGSFVAGQ